ncbi:unnamed protein product [Rotaria sp. Silwood2]|nr:unnamed protein product [Rotaria sp. Silwood2]CAF3296426.1 unnamed protein product [Rotaria sp. Silwood2]
MGSNTDPHQMVLTSIVSTSPSVASSTHPNGLVAKRSLLARPMTSINRISIPEHASATLTFHSINYIVGAKSTLSKRCVKYPNLPFLKAREPKQVLFDVSGKFMNGMNAILGPSGCGKSSLLDVLADRKDPNGLSGLVQVDGAPRHPSFKYTVGYVVQEDICSGTLTVRENLWFSINLRMSKEVLITEKKDHVARVIKELGLEACADTRVGTEFLRGVSGGEKKRTCIGMELVLSPKILFLDEPTTDNVVCGQLIEDVQQQPYAVILFDEVEKGHPCILDILLKVLNGDCLTNDKNRIVDFTNTVIILSTNIGVQYIFEQIKNSIYSEKTFDEKLSKTIKNHLMNQISSYFRLEFLNRLDGIVFFQPLYLNQLSSIIHLQFRSIEDLFKEEYITIRLTDKAIQLILKTSYNPVDGVQSLKHHLEQHIITQVRKHLMRLQLPSHCHVIIDTNANDQYRVDIQ